MARTRFFGGLLLRSGLHILVRCPQSIACRTSRNVFVYRTGSDGDRRCPGYLGRGEHYPGHQQENAKDPCNLPGEMAQQKGRVFGVGLHERILLEQMSSETADRSGFAGIKHE